MYISREEGIKLSENFEFNNNLFNNFIDESSKKPEDDDEPYGIA